MNGAAALAQEIIELVGEMTISSNTLFPVCSDGECRQFASVRL
jgi:hypothetical protein